MVMMEGTSDGVEPLSLLATVSLLAAVASGCWRLTKHLTAIANTTGGND